MSVAIVPFIRTALHCCHLMTLFVLVLTSCAATSPPVVNEIRLHSQMSWIEEPAVPRLHEKVNDAVDEVTLELAKMAQWIVTPANQAREGSLIELAIRSSENAKADAKVLTVWDWENRPVAQVKGDGALPQVVRMRVEGRGVFLLTLDGFRDGKHAYRLVRSFAVLPANDEARSRWKNSDYWLGICAFPGRYHWSSGGKPSKPDSISEENAREIEAEAMAKLGLTVARLDVSMVLPENEKAPIDWKRMDAAVDAYTSRGFELALQLMHPPDWAMEEKYKSETKDRWRFPRREEPYRRYVREIVSRYGKHAKFVQVYNEPDQLEFWAASSEEFVTELGRAREEIRKLLPTTPIVNGGYAFIDPKRTEYFTLEFNGKIDLAAYHSHGNLRELKRDVTHMRQLHEAAGYDKPRYVNTECGFAAWRLDQERAQAASVVQKILYSWAHGDEGMLLFASRMTKAPGRTGRDFGFLDYDFCPRFVYGTVAAFVDLFAGAKFERVLLEADSAHAYLFRRGTQHIVAYFAVVESKALTITSDAKAAKLIDAMGNASDHKGDVSRLNVNAGALVKTIILEGATLVELSQ